MERPSLRQLECVVAVQQHRSFSKAAQAVYLSQPALSQQILQLEAALGLRLFERGRRGVLVTPAGEELVRRAREALVAVDAFVETGTALRDPLAGTLKLGVIPTLAPYLLPDFVPALRRRLPELALQIHEARTQELVRRTEEGELDLALLALEAELGSLERRALFADAFLAALPAEHPLAKRKRLSLADLAGSELLLLQDGHCLRDQALQVCNRAGLEEPVDYRAASLGTLVRMVAAGAGVTLLPELALASEVRARDKIAVVPLAEKAGRTIGLAWRKSSPRHALYRVVGELLGGR